MSKLRDLYSKYKSCMVRIAVETKHSDQSNGAGFHIGNGILVTAGHVVAGNKILEVRADRYGPKTAVNEVIMSPDPKIDLAILRTDFGRYRTDHIPIGGHLNDWIGDEFVLSAVLAMGYPRIPLSREPVLVTYEGEVAAVVDMIGEEHPYFVISPIARGGFSGGPVISEWDFLLGVVTHSCVENDKDLETGYFSLLSIEPLLQLLADNDVRPPGVEDEIWELFKS